MKKLFFILFSAISFAQTPEIYGLWVNGEGEFVEIRSTGEFITFFVPAVPELLVVLPRRKILF